MPEAKTLRLLLLQELGELQTIERQLQKALPKIVRGSACDTLQAQLTQHLKRTDGHLDRLSKIAKQLQEELMPEPAPAIQALVEAGEKVTGQGEPDLMRDLALIALCQKIEHYEIAAYGTARTLASKLGEAEVAEVLLLTLKEEEEAVTALGVTAAEIEVGAIRPTD